MRMKTTVKLRAEADCPSHSLSKVKVRDLEFAIDEPTERGGTNLGPTPTDTALAALIGCTNVIGHKCADKLGIDIGTLEVKVASDFDRRGVTLTEEIDVPFEAVALTVLAHGSATEEELQKVAREVEKFCPLSKLFVAAGTKLETTWHKA